MNLLRHRPLCGISCVLLVCCLLLLRLPPMASLGLALALGVLSFLLRQKRLVALLLLLLLGLCCSILMTEWHPRAILARAEQGDVLELTVSDADGSGTYLGVSVRLNRVPCPFARLRFEADEELSVGDRVTLSVASLSVIKECTEDGIHASVRKDRVIAVEHRPYSARAILDAARGAISDRLDAIGESEVGALLSALLLGEPKRLSLAASSSFRRLGLSHVLAISGMHLLVIAALISRLLLRVGIPRRARSLITSLFLILYAAAVGATPSILRALCMALVSEASFFVGRRTDSLTSLFFSGSVLAVITPRVLLSLSFQLSFAATFGVIACAHVLRHLRLSEKVVPWLYRFLVFPASMSIFALLFTLPLTLSGFGRLSLAALPANLLFAPLYELLLCVGLLSLCIGPILPIRLLVRGLGGTILALTEWAGTLPLLLIDASHPIVLGLFALLAFLALLHLLCRRTTRRAVYLTVLPTLSLLMLALALLCFPTRKSGDLTVYTNGHSGEILVLSTGRDRALIDLSQGNGDLLRDAEGGLSRDAVTELSFYLPAEYGPNTLSAVMRLTNRYLVRLILLPDAKSEKELSVRQALVDYLTREKIPYRTLSKEPITLSAYRLSIKRSSDAVLRLDLEYRSKSACYLSGAAAGLLHYADIPFSDHLILGSRGASASRLPDTSRYAEHLVLCSEIYPEIYHSGRVTRPCKALTLSLTE